MPQYKVSATLDACDETLDAFRADEHGYFPRNAPYRLIDIERAAVSALLGYAKKLDRENADLKLMLAGLQGDVDRSIRYLDPDR